MSQSDQFSWNNNTYSRREASSRAGHSAVVWAVTFCFLWVIFGIIGITTVVKNNDAEREYKKDLSSAAFFTAVYENDPNSLSDLDLRNLLTDLRAYESEASETAETETNELVPTSLEDIIVPNAYGNVCSKLHQFATSLDAENTGCSNTGKLTTEFLYEYSQAKLGDSKWLNFEPEENYRISWKFLGLKFSDAGLVALGIAWVFGSIGWAMTNDRWTKPWPTRNTALVSLFWSPVGAIIALTTNRKYKKFQASQPKRKYQDEIAKISAQIDMLQQQGLRHAWNSEERKALNEKVKELTSIKKDLEEWDTEMGARSIQYLADEFVEEARLLRADAELEIQAYDEVQKIE